MAELEGEENKHTFHFISAKVHMYMQEQSMNYISLEKGSPSYYTVTHSVGRFSANTSWPGEGDGLQNAVR